jgi:hypothetical protein
MRGHEPHHEIAQIIVVPRPIRQMKMVGRQATRETSNRSSLLCLFQQLHESGEIGVVVENGFPSVAPIKHVMAIAGSGISCGVWHGGDFLGCEPEEQAKCMMSVFSFAMPKTAEKRCFLAITSFDPSWQSRPTRFLDGRPPKVQRGLA